MNTTHEQYNDYEYLYKCNNWVCTMYMNNWQEIITFMHFCETVLRFIVAIARYLCWYLIVRCGMLPEIYNVHPFAWMSTKLLYSTYLLLFLGDGK